MVGVRRLTVRFGAAVVLAAGVVGAMAAVAPDAWAFGADFTVSTSPLQLAPGKSGDLVITVTNRGRFSGSPRIHIDQPLRNGIALAGTSGGFCNGSRTVSCGLGSLDPGDARTVRLTYRATSGTRPDSATGTVTVRDSRGGRGATTSFPVRITAADTPATSRPTPAPTPANTAGRATPSPNPSAVPSRSRSSSRPPDGLIKVSGSVTDGATGKPVPGAFVEVVDSAGHRGDAVAGPDGTFSIVIDKSTPLRVGRLTLLSTAPGFARFNRTITGTSPTMDRLALVMQPAVTATSAGGSGSGSNVSDAPPPDHRGLLLIAVTVAAVLAGTALAVVGWRRMAPPPGQHLRRPKGQDPDPTVPLAIMQSAEPATGATG
jgi:hypothetical protein